MKVGDLAKKYHSQFNWKREPQSQLQSLFLKFKISCRLEIANQCLQFPH